MASPATAASDSAVPPRTGSDRVRDILARTPGLPGADVADVAAQAGVSPRTVQRVKREMNGAPK
jgi:AraC-like DNA-binding protein